MSQDLAAFLSSIPAFAALDGPSLSALADVCEARRYPDRSVILQQGATSSPTASNPTLDTPF